MGDTAHPNHRPLASLPAELRRTSVPPAARRWVARVAGTAVASVRRLPGASSTAVHAVRLEDGTQLVLRRYVWPGYLEAEPDAVTREIDALRFAHAHGLPVAQLVAADVDGHAVGDGIATVLTEMLPGRAVALPDPRALAQAAASIHAIDASDFPHAYFAWYAGSTGGAPAASSRPELWERALAVWRGCVPEYEPVFVHRDFHPGNLLWQRGELTGIVDWANACRGPRGCDVAHCCANLRTLGGDEPADAFRVAYETLTGTATDPFWDLASILEHGPSFWSPAQLDDSEPRLERALAAMGEAGRRRH